jgi:hypothetical protein
MINSLRTSEDYELFIYTIADQFPSVRRSTVALIRRGATIARVTGEIYFDSSVRLVVRERLVYNRLPVVIDSYGYEVWRGDKKLYWYNILGFVPLGYFLFLVFSLYSQPMKTPAWRLIIPAILGGITVSLIIETLQV